MIRFDDQSPMSPAADKWGESVLIKSDKFRDEKISNFFKYGPDKSHRIYVLPRKININNTFLFNIHGGAWEFGYPEWMLFTYEYFKNYNLNLVVPGYRLAPKSKFKEQIEDLNNSINFIKKQYGENLNIILAGHSAGAHLAYYASKYHKVYGLILSSGVYDLTTYTKKYVDQITSKNNSAKSISPMYDDEKIKTPILLTYTEIEEQIYKDQSKDFYSKIKNNNINNLIYKFKEVDHYHEPNAMNKKNVSWDKTFSKWLQKLA